MLPQLDDALQRQNTKISKQIFPVKEYRGLSPNFHIHASVSDLYIPTIGLPILLEEICRPILGLYKSQTGTWMLKIGAEAALFPEKEYIKGIFLTVCMLMSVFFYGTFLCSTTRWGIEHFSFPCI